ncbi:MAG: nitroreductase family protein [Thermomicrobiales bacterium]
MTDQDAGIESVRTLENVRQIREYTSEPVADDMLHQLLEVARWSGSYQNTQPWQFVVVTDKATLQSISEAKDSINWVAKVPIAIAIVLNGDNEVNEAHDLGRVTERLLIAAKFLGLGAGTAWLGAPEQQTRIKQLLAVPEERTLRSVVAVGHPQPGATQKLGRKTSGRKPLDELVNYGRFGQSQP